MYQFMAKTNGEMGLSKVNPLMFGQTNGLDVILCKLVNALDVRTIEREMARYFLNFSFISSLVPSMICLDVHFVVKIHIIIFYPN